MLGKIFMHRFWNKICLEKPIQDVLVTEPVLKIVYHILTCVLSCPGTLLLSAVNDMSKYLLHSLPH